MAQRAMLTVTQAARLCSCSRDTVLLAIGRGDLNAHRLGPRGHYRLLRADVRRWLRGEQPVRRP